MTFDRITLRADQMGGVPCIRGLRIPVKTVVRMVANGLSNEEILDLYPDLEAEDIREALLYAAEKLRGSERRRRQSVGDNSLSCRLAALLCSCQTRWELRMKVRSVGEDNYAYEAIDTDV